MTNAADSAACSTGGWRERLKRFHEQGVKRDRGMAGARRSPDVIRDILAIVEGKESLVFPAKTYVVAICYADYIARVYEEPFLKVLAYPNLLYDDEHFRPYDGETCSVYDFAIPLVLSEAFKRSELYRVIIGYCKEELGEVTA